MNWDLVSAHALSLSLATFAFVLVNALGVALTVSSRRAVLGRRRVEAVVRREGGLPPGVRLLAAQGLLWGLRATRFAPAGQLR